MSLPPPNSLESLTNMVSVSAAKSLDQSALDHYDPLKVDTILTLVVTHLEQYPDLTLPYFADIDHTLWHNKPKSLDIYLTDIAEGRELNLESRDKDYATNILSYPSQLPSFMLEALPELPLGELIICQAVVEREACDQDKSLSDHVTHLLVHGILHLIGFDHELGPAEQEQMEGFEIAILAQLGIANPYV